MVHIVFNPEEDNLVTPRYSKGRGPVLRSDSMEVTKISFKKGEGAVAHSHPEEQFVYVLSGRSRVTVDGETYEVSAGEGSYRPANAVHSQEALEDTTSLSFKRLVDPAYDATGRLDQPSGESG
ncbi:MAG: cupin domain-containing protein [Propionibacteriales bacterium]|nr:cupin domain-containing protein [Propionibacteriales bacterium]